MRAIAFLAFLAACGETATTPTAPPEPACDLSLDSLPGKTFVMSEIQADKSEKPNPQARMMFEMKDGKPHVKYTVKSLANVYDYTCESARENEYKCVTKLDLMRTCLALEVNKEGACTKDAIKVYDAAATDEELDKAIKEAKEQIAKYKPTSNWKQFQIMNNNVANTLQGVLYAKIDAKKCRLMVDDMFLTIYNGKKTEDFNPVGTNPFELTTNEYLFEDCPSPRVMADLLTDAMPAKISDIPPNREHAVGKPVHYYYIMDDDTTKAAADCTYSLDAYANWAPVEKGVKVEPDSGKLTWHYSHAWEADDRIAVGGGKKGGVFHIVRHKECAGKKEMIDTLCNAAQGN